MNSIGEECTELKKQYDACFNSWFSDKFLKGDNNDSVCAPIFKVYQQCVKVIPSCSIFKNALSNHNHKFQKALKDQQIEFKEINDDHLGSDKECSKPQEKS